MGVSCVVQECFAGAVRLVSSRTADVHAALHACPPETRSTSRQPGPLSLRAKSTSKNCFQLGSLDGKYLGP